MNKEYFYRMFMINLECERTKLGLTQAQMAEKLDLSCAAYKKLISGDTSKVSLFTAFKAYEITGRLPFMLAEAHDDLLDCISELFKLRDKKQPLAFIKSIIQFEVEFSENQDSDEYIDVIVPTGNLEDGMIYDSCNVIRVNAKEYKHKYGDQISCGIKITTNHLHPVYHMGDILLISNNAPRTGDTGIFINKKTNRVYIRHFIQGNPCILEPINGYGKTFTVNPHDPEDMSQWIKFGYVLSKIRA